MALALIGVGKWGRNIVSTLETIPGAKLKYLCARTKDSLSSYDDKYQKSTDWRSLLGKEDIDGILIATPPSTHRDLIESALIAGKHVFVEKPMVLSFTDARHVQKLVVSSGNVFMVGYQYLFNDNVRYLRKEVKEGSLGRILEVKSEHILSPSRPDVGIFWDAGSHPLSIFQYLFSPQKLLSAEGEIQHDSAFVKVRFQNAPPLEMVMSCRGPIKTRKFTLRSEKGTATIDETLEKNKLTILKNGKMFNPQVGQKQSLRNEIEHFLHCIQTGSAPLTNIGFGCQITKWLETISKKLSG